MWQSCHCGEGQYVGVCGTVSVVRCRATGKLATHFQRISQTARELGHELLMSFGLPWYSDTQCAASVVQRLLW
jgi:hypothetical protein